VRLRRSAGVTFRSESVAYLNEVWLTEERCGPRNSLAWWDKNDRGELICYALMTTLKANWQT
jgi:hypothetical protein